MPLEYEDKSKSIGRKLSNIFESRTDDIMHVNKSLFVQKPDTIIVAQRLLDRRRNSSAASVINIAETERSKAWSCLECIWTSLRIREGT